jgi:hypothetical protein
VVAGKRAPHDEGCFPAAPPNTDEKDSPMAAVKHTEAAPSVWESRGELLDGLDVPRRGCHWVAVHVAFHRWGAAR